MKGKTSQLLRGFLFRRVSLGGKSYHSEEPEWAKKKYDSKAKEMCYLNNLYCFWWISHRSFFLSSHNLSSDSEIMTEASMGQRDQVVEMMIT